MHGLYAGFSALRASQLGIDVTAENLANANTPGYHRRDVILRERVFSGNHQGYGVDIDTIRRIRSTVTEGLITDNISATGFSSAQLTTLERLESLLVPGDGSIHDRLQSWFGSLHDLSTNADDEALQRLVVERATQLANGINGISAEINRQRSELDRQISAAVGEVNELSEELTELHHQLLRAADGRQSSNALRDRYEQLVNQLAEFVDARPDIENERHHVIRFAGGRALIGQEHRPLEVSSADGQTVVRYAGTDEPLSIGGGKLAGLLSARNELLEEFDSQLQGFTTDLVTAVDSIHSRGVGQSGPFETLSGVRGVQDVDAPLATAGSDFPISSGPLYVSVTDQATGERTLHRVDIDAQTESLRDVAANLNTVANLSAFVSEESGSLTLAALPGYAFDFTGRPETHPDASGITGTSRPELFGLYTGAANDSFTFEAASTGTIGLTDDFFVDVRDSAGNIVNRLQVGKGYEPGSRIAVADGIFVSFSAGTLNAADSATSDVVSEPDSGGLLVGLGLNTFFHGTRPHNIRVSQTIADDPAQLAGSVSGEASDTRNLNKLLSIRDALVASNDTRTLEQFIGDITADIGTQVASSRLILEGHTATGQQLEAQREAVSGVDPNEELVRMMTYQRAFQAASRVIAAVDSTFDDLLTMF